MKKIINTITAVSPLGIFAWAHTVFAQEEASVQDTLIDKLNKTASGFWNPVPEGEGSVRAAALIGQVINFFLGFLGVIFIILIIYAGIKWMLARGNDEEVVKARTTLIRAFQGLIIVLIAYAAVNAIGFALDRSGLLQ